MMSVDISDPSILSAREGILSQNDPRSWLCLGYTDPPNALRLVGLGSDPALPSIRQLVHEAGEQVLYAYAEVKGKGLLVAYIHDSIGGVKRARAIVHSRAVAGLFPDYSALLTIAHHSQLSDEEVSEKLGVSLPLYTSVRRASKPLPNPLSSPPLPRTPQTPSSMHTPQLVSSSPAIDPFSVVALRGGEGRYPVPSHGRTRSGSVTSETSVSLIPMGAVHPSPGVGPPVSNGDNFATTPKKETSNGDGRSASVGSHTSLRSKLSRRSSKKDLDHGKVTPTTPNSKDFEAARTVSTGGHLPDLQETLQATPSPIKDTASPAGHVDNNYTTPVKSTPNGNVQGQQSLGRGPAPLAPALPTDLSRLTSPGGRTVSSPVYRHSVAQRIVSAPIVPNERRPLPVPGAQSPQQKQPQQFQRDLQQEQDQPRQPQYPLPYSSSAQRQFELARPPGSHTSPQPSPSKAGSRMYSGQQQQGAPSPTDMRESYSAQQLRQFQQSELQRAQPLSPPAPAPVQKEPEPESEQSAEVLQAAEFDRHVRAEPPNPPRLVGTPSSDGRAEELEMLDDFPSKPPAPRPVVLPETEMETSSPKGISSEDHVPKRARKPSFTSRLGALVTRSPKSPKSPRNVSTGKIPDSAVGTANPNLRQDKGPTSPNGMSRFIKNFGRKSSGAAAPSPPTSPITSMNNALPSPGLPPPTPPPKSEHGFPVQQNQQNQQIPQDPQSQTLRSVNSPLASARKSPRRVPVPVPGSADPSASPSSSFSATVGGNGPKVVAVPSSPSAQKALAEASQRSVRDESAIQERFRRDTEEKERRRQEAEYATSRQSQKSRVSNRSRQSGGPMSPVRPKRHDDDQYFDQSRRSSRRSLKSQPHEEPLSEAAGYARSIKGRGSGVYDSVYDQEYSLEYAKQSPVQATFDPSVRPTAAVEKISGALHEASHADSVEAVQTPSSLSGSHKGLPLPSTEGISAAGAAGVAAAGAGVAATYHAVKSAIGSGDGTHENSPHQGLQDETRENEGVANRMAELDLAEDGQAGGTAVDMSLRAEAHARALHDARDVYDESEDYGAPDIPGGFVTSTSRTSGLNPDDDTLLAQPQAEDDESMIIARAIQEEEERAERQRQEEEKRKLEEQARIVEQQRLAELAELERLENVRRAQEAKRAEERRIAEEKAAEERRLAEIKEAEIAKRREEAYARLLLARQEGGMMLSGWVTVQTIKSMMWRRRWFNLFSHELRLFKSQGDTKPITVIPLGPSSTVSREYEESQVQGSFKVIAPSGEEYFLYTDTPDDNALILKGLSLVTGR